MIRTSLPRDYKRKEEVDFLIYYHALTFIILLQSSISIRQQIREMAVSLRKQGPISLQQLAWPNPQLLSFELGPEIELGDDRNSKLDF